MKRIYTIVGGLFLLASCSSLGLAATDKAQETPKEKVVSHKVSRPLMGVEGGFNVADLKGSDVNAVVDSRLGFVGGAFLNFHVGRTLAFQPEFLYAQKGGKINGSSYQLDYMEIPLLVNLTFGVPAFNPSILVGPAFSTKVASEGVIDVNKKDVGLILGGQVSFSKILVSVRYEVGLTDVSENEDVKNGTFTILMGLSLI